MALLISVCMFRKMGKAYSAMFLFSCDFADKIITPKGYGIIPDSNNSGGLRLFSSPELAFHIIC